jgi:hypothetical protein
MRISGDIVRIGRSPDNTIALNDPAVSRYHLNFYVQDGALIAEDAGSQNGFTVNGQNVKGSVKLGVGDKIGIGSREYLVSVAGQPAPTLSGPLPINPFLNPKFAGSRPQARPSYSQASDTGASGRNRVFLVIIVSVVFGALYVRNKEIDVKRTPASAKPVSNEPPSELPFEREEKFRLKGITEVQAEAKFRDSQRDYYNKNYSRAILGFRETLTLNSNHEQARLHLISSEENLAKEMKDLLEDTEKSLANMQFGRAKSQAMRVLTLVAEQTPSFNRIIAQETTRDLSPISKTQDENLLAVPCEKYKDPETCKRAQKLLKVARQKLGDEDTLKEVR